jgi:hypothetical protein
LGDADWNPVINSFLIKTTMTVNESSLVHRGLRYTLFYIFLPFVNGIMLGLGEMTAHVVVLRYGWLGWRAIVRNT